MTDSSKTYIIPDSFLAGEVLRSLLWIPVGITPFVIAFTLNGYEWPAKGVNPMIMVCALCLLFALHLTGLRGSHLTVKPGQIEYRRFFRTTVVRWKDVRRVDATRDRAGKLLRLELSGLIADVIPIEGFEPLNEIEELIQEYVPEDRRRANNTARFFRHSLERSVFWAVLLYSIAALLLPTLVDTF